MKEKHDYKRIAIYCDGGCLNNQSDSKEAYGSFLIDFESLKCIGAFRLFFGNRTNNEAEYLTLINSLLHIKTTNEEEKYKVKDVIIYMDSQLVLTQIKGVAKVKAPHLKSLNKKAIELLKDLVGLGFKIKLAKVPREKLVSVLGH